MEVCRIRVRNINTLIQGIINNDQELFCEFLITVSSSGSARTNLWNSAGQMRSERISVEYWLDPYSLLGMISSFAHGYDVLHNAGYLCSDRVSAE